MRIKTSQIAWMIPFILPLTVFGDTAGYQELKRKWESARSEELALEKTCTNPDAPCALTLFDIRANRKSLEKKLKAQEKTLKVTETASGAKRATNIKIKNTDQSKKTAENKKNLESSIKKIRKQQKTLRISALINAGVGGYLLLNHCKPPAKKAGCVLGPLALSQAYIHYNQAKKMNKTANSLSKVTPSDTNSGALKQMNQKSSENNNPNTETEDPQLIVNGKPISEVTFPCPGGKGGSRCVLEEDGTTIRSTEGNSIATVSELAGIKPTGKEAGKAISNALKKQKPLLEAVKKMDPQFNPVSNLNPAGMETASVPFIADLGEGSLGGNTPPSSDAAIPYGESGKDSSGAKNNFPFVGGAPENAGEEGDYYSGGYEEDIEEEAAEEAEDNIEEEVQKLLDKFSGNQNKKKADAATKKPLPFGKGEKISQSGRSILNVIRERYRNYRSRGEFIHINPKKKPPDANK